MKYFVLTLIIAMTALVANAQAAHSVALSWTAPTVDSTHDAATGYNVYRTQTTGGCTVVTTTGCSKVGPATTTTFTDTTVAASTTYFYVVTATNSAGESGPSNQVQANVPANTPNAPSALTVTSVK